MHLDQQSQDADWNGTVPSAHDARVVALVVVIAAVAASLNLPYGGPVVAVVAFGVLAGGGIGSHLLGQRRLRRLTDGLVERWAAADAQIDDVTRTSTGLRTEWVVHTAEGPITVGGLALAPISKLSIEWSGTGDTLSASSVERDLDRIAAEWRREVFEL